MKKRLLLISIFFVSSLLLNAQEFSGKFASEKIIREACTNACVIVEQTYQLKEVKTGNIYGLNGHEEFGSVISLGIATEKGLVVGPRATTPWDYD
jgi:mannose/fructose/N-acetylgalactosamine-specific phosphotransferase system component IIB